MRRFTIPMLVLAGLSMSVKQAAATPESRAAVLFLLIEPGARAIAMGESYVAIADDATASYFNPAALAGQTDRQLSFTHAKWLPAFGFDDMSYEFLAFSQPVEGWGNIGLNGSLLQLGEQTRTGERGEVLGTFSSYDLAVSAAYGSEIADNMSAGSLSAAISPTRAPASRRAREWGTASPLTSDSCGTSHRRSTLELP